MTASREPKAAGPIARSIPTSALLGEVAEELGVPGLPAFRRAVVEDPDLAARLLEAHALAESGDALDAETGLLGALRPLIRRHADRREVASPVESLRAEAPALSRFHRGRSRGADRSCGARSPRDGHALPGDPRFQARHRPDAGRLYPPLSPRSGKAIDRAGSTSRRCRGRRGLRRSKPFVARVPLHPRHHALDVQGRMRLSGDRASRSAA